MSYYSKSESLISGWLPSGLKPFPLQVRRQPIIIQILDAVVFLFIDRFWCFQRILVLAVTELSNPLQTPINFKRNIYLKRKFILNTFLLPILLVTLISCSKTESSKTDNSLSELKDYALTLKSYELYPKAIAVFKEYLQNSGDQLNEEEKANIHYLMAGMYMDELFDYEDALAELLFIENLLPKAKILEEVKKKKIECLEKLNRPADAQRALKEATAIDQKEKIELEADDTVIAEVGDKKFTLQNLEQELTRLPEALRNRFSTPEGKTEYLKQQIATELLYEAALRKGYDTDKDVRQALGEYEKTVLAQKYLNEELQQSSTKIRNEDVKLFYEAHRSEFIEPAKVEVFLIQVEDEKQAQKILEDLKQGKSFSELVKLYSNHTASKDKEGFLGWLEKGASPSTLGLCDDTQDSLFKDKPEQVFMVTCDNKYQIIRVGQRTETKQKTFSEVEKDVRRALESQWQAEATQSLIEKMLAGQEVKIYSDLIK